MKRLLVAACVGALTLSASVGAVAATKKTTKKAPATAAAAAIPAGAEKWQCELGNSLYIAGNMMRDEVITLHWEGRNFRMPRQTTVTGADRYFDAASGMDLVVIPSKAMLFDRKEGHRLADECQTVAMQGGAAAPTQAGGLRAPTTAPLLAAPPSGQPQH